MSSLTIAIVVAFVIGYFFIAIESVTKVNKAAIALLMFVVCWTLFMIDPAQYLATAIGDAKALIVSWGKRSSSACPVTSGIARHVVVAACRQRRG